MPTRILILKNVSNIKIIKLKVFVNNCTEDGPICAQTMKIDADRGQVFYIVTVHNIIVYVENV